MATERKVSATNSRRSRAAATAACGPLATIHASLSCGRPTLLESPPRVKVRAARLAAKLRPSARPSIQGVVQEDLIGDERPPALGSQRARGRPASSGCTNEPVGLFGWTTTTARTLSGAWARACGSRRHACLGVELVGHRLHALHASQVLEQRVRGRGHEHRLARVRQELEQERVGLAGGGREKDALGVHGGRVAQVLARHGLPGRAQAARVRVVLEAGGVRERGEQPGGVCDAACGRVGNRQVETRGR